MTFACLFRFSVCTSIISTCIVPLGDPGTLDNYDNSGPHAQKCKKKLRLDTLEDDQSGYSIKHVFQYGVVHWQPLKSFIYRTIDLILVLSIVLPSVSWTDRCGSSSGPALDVDSQYQQETCTKSSSHPCLCHMQSQSVLLSDLKNETMVSLL